MSSPTLCQVNGINNMVSEGLSMSVVYPDFPLSLSDMDFMEPVMTMLSGRQESCLMTMTETVLALSAVTWAQDVVSLPVYLVRGPPEIQVWDSLPCQGS